MEQIKNDRLTVAISPRGAELQSILFDGTERLWQGDPAFWEKRSPLLFPMVGRLKNCSYLLNGTEYHAPMHGFYGQVDFTPERVSESCVRFVLEDDDETKKIYPFSFRLTIEFRLEGTSIVKTHTVENTGSVPMPFEIGGHDAYRVRLEPDEHMADYYVQFEGLTDALPVYEMDADGIIDLPLRTVPLVEGRLETIPEQVGLDTFIMQDLPVRRVKLAAKTNPHSVTVDFADFPYLGIWTCQNGQEARYLCIEPWSSLPDGHFMSRELSEKPGAITLQPGKKSVLSYREIFA